MWHNTTPTKAPKTGAQKRRNQNWQWRNSSFGGHPPICQTDNSTNSLISKKQVPTEIGAADARFLAKLRV